MATKKADYRLRRKPRTAKGTQDDTAGKGGRRCGIAALARATPNFVHLRHKVAGIHRDPDQEREGRRQHFIAACGAAAYTRPRLANAPCRDAGRIISWQPSRSARYFSGR